MTDTKVSVPQPQAIIALLKPGHPRLLARADDFARLRELMRSDEVLRQKYVELRQTGEKLLGQPVSAYVIPDGKRLLATSRRVLDRMQTLGLLYQLDGDRRWVDRAWAEAEAVAAFKEWNPSHFLDTAEMCYALALAYDWMFDAWSPTQRNTIKSALVNHALQPALAAYRGTAPHSQSWWTNVEHNWNQVCNGGIGLGALALAEEEPELAGELLHEIISLLPRALVHYGPDGAWAEGPGYWSYATKYTVAILAGLKSSLDTDFGLSDTPGLDKAGDFLLACIAPSGLSFNFADASASKVNPPELLWLATRFDRPEYAQFQMHAGSAKPMALLWYRPMPMDVKPLPRAGYFRGSEVAAFRSQWNDPQAFYVGFKAGDNAVNHSNLDLGSFIVEAQGQRWVVDLGPDDYNLPEYFGKLRWTYYRLRAEGHNTLVLMPDDKPDQNPKAKTKVIRFVGDDDPAPRAVADLTPAYADRAGMVKRGIIVPGLEQLLIRDEIELKHKGDAWWFMHTPADVVIIDEGRVAQLAIKDKKFTVRLLEPGSARLQVMDATPLPTSPQAPKQAQNKGIRKLAIHLQNVEQVTIIVQLVPQGPDALPTAHELVGQPLNQW